MIVKIDNLAHDFRGITKINDKITFVDNALPDEVVDIKITLEKKKYNEAKVISYIEKSNDRDNFVCPYYGICGGCDIGHIKYNKQLDYKKDIFINIMKRYANIDINPNIISSDNLYYRNKISLKVFNNKLSLVKKSSNDYINIDKCYLVNDNINKIINKLNNIDLSNINDIIIRGNNDIMVIINGDTNINDIINYLKDDVKSIIYNNKKVYGSDYIISNVNNRKYAIYPNSFFQVNDFMIAKLYDKVLEYAKSGNKLLDLYCGAGTIGIYLSNNFDNITGIEINEDAIKGANLNKGLNNINNINFKCMNTSNIEIKDYDVVIVDPPRNGLDKITINKLCNSFANKIIYVSCNPITLARDINILKDKYNISNIEMFDNFPNTKHCESITVLEMR